MEEKPSMTEPEVWGGLECTINRIGDQYKDQLEYSGHYDRPGDIEVIAALGITAIRYPILWEKHQPKKNAKINWQWTDNQLAAIRDSGMTPIAGLLHHGSGPVFTNLLDPEFPGLFAEFAFEVASRYPWVTCYTPVNEPLTTARFSGLYGLWFPHHRSEESFYRMLLHQLKATVMAMEAIRSVNPVAKWIQTEDLGKTYATPLLSYQADFENDRRLLTFDILTRRLQPGHPQYAHMLGCGIGKEEIDFFQIHSIAPDILGLNYYVTSERWLDEKIELYPRQTHGGNGYHRYADTEAVRANSPARRGFKILASEIWERYQIPIAVTESHLHCTREEQLRWLKEIWDDSVILKNRGVDIRAVTAWAMLGSFDWDSLLTKTGSQYESGLFDVNTETGQLRPTAIAALVKSLCTGQLKLHPVLSASGWWRGPHEVITTTDRAVIIIEKTDLQNTRENHEKLSRDFITACNQRRISCMVVNDPCETDLEKLNPWAVVNLGSQNFTTESLATLADIQYVTFTKDESLQSCLKVIAEKMPMTIHQINKVLDLMIDGDQGCWVFTSDEIVFKTTESGRRQHVA